MAWVNTYRVLFQSLGGVQYVVNIYEQDSTVVSPTILTGAGDPFVTQEDDDNNIFTPIRKQTGFLRVIDETEDGSLLETLLPKNNTQKLVKLYGGVYNNGAFVEQDLMWVGFLCSEAYTQPWDKQKKVLEFPVKSVLAATEDVFLPLSMLGPSTKVVSYFIAAYQALNVSAANIYCISNLNDIVTDMLSIYVSPATFFTEDEVSNQGDVTIVEKGYSFYDTLSCIAALYGLMIRELNGDLYIVMYDNAAGKIGRARLSWNDMLAIENGTVTSVAMGSVPELDLLNSVDFAGVDNVCTFLQGAKDARVHLSIGGLFPKITLPQTSETADELVNFAMHSGTLYVQPHAPRTVIESTNFFEYQRHTLIGASDYATMLQKTIIKGYTSNPYNTPTETHLYTGAFPIRWFYQTGTERVLLKNGLYLNTQYRTPSQTETVPIDLLYRIDSKVHIEAIDGWMWINFDWHNIIWYDTLSDPKYLWDDAKNVLGYDVISQITMCLRVGDKWWNGTDWVQSSSIPPVHFSFDVTNNTINTNKTVDINVDEDEGFFIPVTQELSGDVSFYILDFVPVKYDSTIYAYCYSHILENLTVKHIRPIDAVASERSSNTYFQEIVASGFNGEESIGLEVGTINNNPPYPCFIKRDISTNIEALEYYYEGGVIQTERPEVNLVNRIATQFSEVRRAFTAIKKYTYNALATYTPFEMRYEYLDRKFFGVVRKQSWRDSQQEMKFIEVADGLSPEPPTPTPQNPEIAWSAASASATIGGTNTFPTLSNPHSLPITYSSSDTSVATVDSSGVVTLVSAGSANISASFAGNEDYYASTVSYALAVEVALPYDAEVEYLESTGTQWIDTGINLKQILHTTIDMMITKSITTNSCICGRFFDNSDQRYQLYINSTQKWATISSANRPYFSYSNITAGASVLLNTRYTPTLNNLQIQDYDTTIYLFARNNQTDMLPIDGLRVYSCDIVNDNNVKLREFVPVRVGQVGYLYDRVSDELFGNSGTGAFTLGPDKN